MYNLSFLYLTVLALLYFKDLGVLEIKIYKNLTKRHPICFSLVRICFGTYLQFLRGEGD